MNCRHQLDSQDVFGGKDSILRRSRFVGAEPEGTGIGWGALSLQRPTAQMGRGPYILSFVPISAGLERSGYFPTFLLPFEQEPFGGPTDSAEFRQSAGTVILSLRVVT